MTHATSRPIWVLAFAAFAFALLPACTPARSDPIVQSSKSWIPLKVVRLRGSNRVVTNADEQHFRERWSCDRLMCAGGRACFGRGDVAVVHVFDGGGMSQTFVVVDNRVIADDGRDVSASPRAADSLAVLRMLDPGTVDAAYMTSTQHRAGAEIHWFTRAGHVQTAFDDTAPPCLVDVYRAFRSLADGTR